MSVGELMPIGGHKKKHDPAYAKKIKEGGKKADEIRKKSIQHHHEVEVPVAEAFLEEELKKLDQ